MSTTLYNNLFKQQNMWNMDNIPATTYKVYIDKWDISGEYPFEITRQYTEEYTEEYLQQLVDLTDKEKMIKKIYTNSYYGAYGDRSSFSYTGIKSLYYQNGKVQPQVNVPHEETALCIQKQYLVDHFKHKLTKTSKKKPEFETLTKIVEMYEAEIEIYMNDYPERFI